MDLLKPLPQKGLDKFKTIINRAWAKNEIPEEWKTSHSKYPF
jgi:hypothetical protein